MMRCNQGLPQTETKRCACRFSCMFWCCVLGGAIVDEQRGCFIETSSVVMHQLELCKPISAAHHGVIVTLSPCMHPTRRPTLLC